MLYDNQYHYEYESNRQADYESELEQQKEAAKEKIPCGECADYAECDNGMLWCSVCGNKLKQSLIKK